MARKSAGLAFSLDPLDPNFVMAKPRQKVDEKVLEDLEIAGNLIETRKRDGYRNYIVQLDSNIRIYSRGIEDVTAKFPHIVQEVRSMELPKRTMLDSEIAFVDKEGNDDIERFTRIAKSNPAQALKLQEEEGFAQAIVFGIIVYGGKLVTTLPYQERLDIIRGLFSKLDFRTYYINPVEILNCSVKEVKILAKKKGWEGLVFYDKTKPTAFGLDGKTGNPIRPDGCWKWKPLKEDDFIVRTWHKGNGRNKDVAGWLPLLQIDPRIGKEVLCGEVGNLKDDMRKYFANAKYPLVVQVSFEMRFSSGKLRTIRFMRVRDDKRPEECVLPLKSKEKRKKLSYPLRAYGCRHECRCLCHIGNAVHVAPCLCRMCDCGRRVKNVKMNNHKEICHLKK